MPEVWRVVFEHSIDGSNWTGIGSATRIEDGWQLAGLSLPLNENHYVRARGFIAAGSTTSSFSICESVRMFYLSATNSGRTQTDFNGDGNPDILWRNTSTGENYVWYLDGVNVLGGGNLPTVDGPELEGRRGSRLQQ